MKSLKSLAVIAVAAFLIGCASQSRVTYNTLATVEAATTGAFQSYLTLVVQGKVRTNDVPRVSMDYNVFKLTWMDAIAVAQWNTNAPATVQVNTASAQVLTDIIDAKSAKGTP